MAKPVKEKTASAGKANRAAASKGKGRKARQSAVEMAESGSENSHPGPAWDDRFVSVAAAIVGSGQGEVAVAKALSCTVEDIRWWREEHPKFDAAFAKLGRPTEFSEAMIGIAQKLAELGATDLQIAQAFEVNVRTIYRWRMNYPAFDAALKIGKEQADALVEQSLFKRATGYTYDSEKVFMVEGEPVRVEVLEHVPPDVKAATMWLLNRMGDKWKNPSHIKHDVEETSPLGQWIAQIQAQAIKPKDTEDAEKPDDIGFKVKE